MSCPTTVSENVCLEALVTINPEVTVGEILTFCIGPAVIGPCPGAAVPSCSFEVSQNICVQVPLLFDAIATAEPIGIVCGTPTTSECVVPTAATTVGTSGCTACAAAVRQTSKDSSKSPASG